MPTCKNCGQHFPNTTVIDGKRKNLQNRKYCLTCSPWGQHNTRAFDHVKAEQKERECMICGKPYKHKGTRCYYCLTNMRRYKTKLDAIVYKGGSCKNCGYDKCPAAMVFHHTNENEKSFEISRAYTRSWAIIKKELDKCVLLCQNCHAELHWNEVDDKRQIVLQRLVVKDRNK